MLLGYDIGNKCNRPSVTR